MWRRACSSSPAKSLPWAALILGALVRRKHSASSHPAATKRARRGPGLSPAMMLTKHGRGCWFASPEGKTHLVGAVCCCSTRKARDRDRAQDSPGLAATTLAATPAEAGALSQVFDGLK